MSRESRSEETRAILRGILPPGEDESGLNAELTQVNGLLAAAVAKGDKETIAKLELRIKLLTEDLGDVRGDRAGDLEDKNKEQAEDLTRQHLMN